MRFIPSASEPQQSNVSIVLLLLIHDDDVDAYGQVLVLVK